MSKINLDNHEGKLAIATIFLASAAAVYSTAGYVLRDADKYFVSTGTDMKLEETIFAPFNVEPSGLK